VEAVALADVATAQADAAAKEQLIDELRASVAWHRVPGLAAMGRQARAVIRLAVAVLGMLGQA
jgi:hypothetical protein